MNYVFCLKWGTKYPAIYVNNLYYMVKRNLHIPFKFVCFTDDGTDIDSEVTIKPLIDPLLKGWWGKISYFKSPLYEFNGTALALDLDLVIVDSIDCFFDIPGNFCIGKDRDDRNGNNSSVMRFVINQHSDIYNDLSLNEDETHYGVEGEKLTRKRYWGDQVWITEKRPNASIFPTDWIRSYKWDCIDKSKKFSVPNQCKIISFHGKPDPHEVLDHVGKYWRK